MDKKNPYLIELDKIVDVLTCADGGPQFVRLRNFVEQMNDRKNNGDVEAKQILDVISQFSRLIDVVNHM